MYKHEVVYDEKGGFMESHVNVKVNNYTMPNNYVTDPMEKLNVIPSITDSRYIHDDDTNEWYFSIGKVKATIYTMQRFDDKDEDMIVNELTRELITIIGDLANTFDKQYTFLGDRFYDEV